MFHSLLCQTLFLALTLGTLFGQSRGDLQTFESVRLVPTDWADGDSFLVKFSDGTEHTLRLYGADCIECHVSDESDARRLRAQRRYFGISGYGGTAEASITLAKELGKEAADHVREVLAKPFKVHTAFADARGDGRYKRIYGFVTTSEGKDLSTHLVRHGLARAFGVYRTSPEGLSREEFESQLKDAELVAAREGLGAWEKTDWSQISEERRAQREEDAESRIALGKQPPSKKLNVNSAARDELMQIPGVGEVTANAIIENRPFARNSELTRVPGIGAATLAKIEPYLLEPAEE